MSAEITFAPRGPKSELENGLAFAPKFDAGGLIPAIAVDATDGTVLMQAYMNREALAETIRRGEAVYWSRSRQELWHKGATSGNVQVVTELLTDCDQDSLVLRVEQRGGAACHTGRRSCFYRRVPLGQTGEVTLEDAGDERVFDPDEVYGAK